MTTVDDMLERVRSVNVLQESQDAIENTREDMILIQQEQMRKGLNADGIPIGFYKRQKYAEMKNAMNPLPGLGIVDLELHGDFKRELFAEVRGEEFIIDSADSKTKFLVDKYTDKAIGLNDDSLDQYAEVVEPVFQEQIKEKLGL